MRNWRRATVGSRWALFRSSVAPHKGVPPPGASLCPPFPPPHFFPPPLEVVIVDRDWQGGGGADAFSERAPDRPRARTALSARTCARQRRRVSPPLSYCLLLSSLCAFFSALFSSPACRRLEMGPFSRSKYPPFHQRGCSPFGTSVVSFEEVDCRWGRATRCSAQWRSLRFAFLPPFIVGFTSGARLEGSAGDARPRVAGGWGRGPGRRTVGGASECEGHREPSFRRCGAGKCE